MKWEELLDLLNGEPIFHSSVLLSGVEAQADVRRQLARWVGAGRLLKLRRSVYVLARPYRLKEPDPFVVANRLKGASYVSFQSALAHYGCIPEHVPTVTSATTGRPETLHTPFGAFVYRHIQTRLFFGFTSITVSGDSNAFVARPEKALLDLTYLSPCGDSSEYIQELRLQNLVSFDALNLLEFAQRTGSAKLLRVAERVKYLIAEEENQ